MRFTNRRERRLALAQAEPYLGDEAPNPDDYSELDWLDLAGAIAMHVANARAQKRNPYRRLKWNLDDAKTAAAVRCAVLNLKGSRKAEFDKYKYDREIAWAPADVVAHIPQWLVPLYRGQNNETMATSAGWSAT